MAGGSTGCRRLRGRRRNWPRPVLHWAAPRASTMTHATPSATLSATLSATVDLRSYGQLHDPDRHDYAQLVLPLAGSLRLDIEGRAGQLDPLRAGVVAPRARHAQAGTG